MTIVAEKEFASRRALRLIHGDLTEANVDVIVNAANANLAHGGGVAGAIVRKGGIEIQKESDMWVQEHGPASHDRPAITTAGRLPSKYVIHAVGPVWGEGDEDMKLHSAVYSALSLADDRGFESLALPAISTGIFGFPKDRGAKVILKAISNFLEDHSDSSLTEVQVILFDQPSVAAFEKAFEARWHGSITSG
ncbi:MAG: macro domain-containing protein [Anaerolineales bacterium]|nr:macro domain-containing protein [Anaerolineales bacterium]